MPPLDKPFKLLAKVAPRPAVWLGLPLLLYAWTVAGPFVCDDLNLLLKAERYIRGESDRLDLFRFAPTDKARRQMRDRGTCPWWSPEGQRIDFFRPLAELSFYLDVRLFGRNATGHRLVSLGWFALALVCVHRLYALASQDSVRAGVATLFFGISQTVTAPVTFISNRSDLLVLVGVTLAGWAYWRAGEIDGSNVPAASRKPDWRLVGLASVSFAFALLAKEVAIALAGVIVAHEWLARRRRLPLAGGRTRATIAIAIFVLAVTYLGYYAASRPWALGLGEYAANHPSLLSKAPQSAPLYLAVWTLGFPIAVLLVAKEGYAAVVAAGGVIVALVVGWHLRKTVRGDRAAVFFGLWAVMFFLPALVTIPEARALSVATAGWAYLLAGLLTSSERGVTVPLWLRHWLLAANGAISIACAIGAVLLTNSTERQARSSLNRYLAAFETPLHDGDTVIVAEPKSALEFICAGDRLEFMTGCKDVAFAYLTVVGTAAEYEREDAHTLLLSAPNGSLFGSPMHRVLLGDDWKPAVGDQFRLTNFTAEIAEVSDGGAVTALRFRFEQPLASPRLHFYPPDLARIARPQ